MKIGLPEKKHLQALLDALQENATLKKKAENIAAGLKSR